MRLHVEHTTTYSYARPVTLHRHRLVLRPREGHDLRVERLRLDVTPACRVEWVRDPKRLATLADISGIVLGLTIDAPATAPGALPQGGETTVDFPNNHLGYSFTWFGFAILTPCLLAFWVWRQFRPKAAA